MWGTGANFPFGGNFDEEPFETRGATAATGAFTRQFRCYPVSFIDKDDLERGDKIILPPSALDTLTRLNITFPMLFQLQSRDGRRTHCGVQEFIAEEGHANLPYWLMQNLLVPEGGMITIRNANLPKGTFVKFQPQTSDFLNISNPKAVLEATLRGFTCLTEGDSIAINYNDRIYHIDVLQVAPGKAISIVDTDVNVEFAPPLDYVEPVVSKPVSSSATAITSKSKGASDVNIADSQVDPSVRLKQRLERLKKQAPDERDADSSDEEQQKPAVPLFPGSGQALKESSAGRSGLTFGASSSGSGLAEERGGEENCEKKSVEKKPFVPFGGSGRSLR